MLKRIYIDNYRCFVNFEFRPAKMSLLLGDNGSGKSTLLSALDDLWNLVVLQRQASEVFLPEKLTRWDKRKLQRFEINIQQTEGEFLYILEIEHDVKRSTASVRSEKLALNGKTLYRYQERTVELFDKDLEVPERTFRFGSQLSYLGAYEQPSQDSPIMAFKQYLFNLHMHKINPAHAMMLAFSEDRFLDTDGSNFPSWFRVLMQEDFAKVNDVFNIIRKAMPSFVGLNLKGSELREGKRGLVANLATDAGPKPTVYVVGFDELSDGQRMLIILYTLLHVSAGPGHILALDEPDNFLALPEIQPWLIALSDRIIESGGQALIISHNPEVIDYLAADSAFVFERPNGGPARVRALSVSREQGLKASELIAQRLLDGQ